MSFMEKRTGYYYKVLISILLDVILVVIAYVQYSYAGKMTEPGMIDAPYPYVMILGAGLEPDGKMSAVLADRIKKGVELYKEGKASNLLITGDDGKFRSNEVSVMQQMAIEQGVPPVHILVDGQGYRTYESCKRAKQIFNINKTIVVTQRFHINRALYLCNTFGIDAIGVVADNQPYRSIIWHWTRDLLASVKAWIDINILTPRSPVK